MSGSGGLSFNPQMQGEYPPHPQKAVLIYVTFGDLLKAVGSNAGEEKG